MLPLTPSAPLRAVTGLQLTLLPEGAWVAAYCQLQRRGSAVAVGSTGSGLTSLAALRAALPEEPTPVALVLAGRGILYRSLPPGGSTGSLVDKLSAALPGAPPHDFYIQHKAAPLFERLGLVRKGVLDALLAELQQAGIWVVDLSLGPVRFAALLPYLPQLAGQSSVLAGDFQLSLDATPAVTDFTARPAAEAEFPALQVGTDAIPYEAVLPYAAALACLTNPAGADIEKLAVPQVTHLRSEWWHRQAYHALRLGVPVVLLIVLLVNFLLSQQLSSTSEELALDVDRSRAVLSNLKSLQQSAAQKQVFLTATGWSQPSWNSVCADRLAASIPAGVQLLVLDISPAQTTSGSAAGHRTAFKSGAVLIKGQCRDAQSLNSWLQKVATIGWVRAVRDQDFVYDYASGLGTFTFTLEISPAALFL